MDKVESEPLSFFEEFQELAERHRFAVEGLEPAGIELSNPVCGDWVRVALQVEEDRVIAYAYQARGCWPVQACLELMGDLLRDVRIECLVGYRLEQFLGRVRGVPASKRHAFSLVHRATLQALALALSQGEEAPARRNSPSGAPLEEKSPAAVEARSEKTVSSAATAREKGYTR